MKLSNANLVRLSMATGLSVSDEELMATDESFQHLAVYMRGLLAEMPEKDKLEIIDALDATIINLQEIKLTLQRG